MKIEIVNREIWLQKIAVALDNIEKRRMEDNAEFILWYKKKYSTSWFGLVRKDPKDVDLPICYWDFGRTYPSDKGFRSEERLLDMQKALKTEGTGRVYIHQDDLDAVERWQ